MQDIAGCRVVVANVQKQDRVVAFLVEAFPAATVVFDRREKPSYGYRAVHVVVEITGKQVEIQVRTTFQHIWAEISEKLADIFGSGIKYGGGARIDRGFLDPLSKFVAEYENNERLVVEGDQSEDNRILRRYMARQRKDIANLLSDVISRVNSKRGG